MEDKKNEKMLYICKIVQRMTVLIGALTFILPLIFWKYIPDVIPTHYGISGQADNYSEKSTLILLFFVVAMLMGVMNIVTYYVKMSATSKYATEAEKSMMDTVYPMVVFMNFAIQGMFAYMMFCSTTSRNLGIFFLPVVMIATFAPVVYFFWKHGKTTKNPTTTLGKYKLIERQEKGTIYRSAVDWWLGILLFGSVGYMVYLTLLPMIKEQKVDWIITISTLFTVAIVAPLFAIKYVFYSEHLLVSCGIYGKVRVAYRDISGVKETHNPLSSAALSLKRIQIDYTENGNHKMVLISPVRKKEFLEKLEEYRGQK